MNFPEINKSSGIKPEFEQWSVRVRKSSLGYDMKRTQSKSKFKKRRKSKNLMSESILLRFWFVPLI